MTCPITLLTGTAHPELAKAIGKALFLTVQPTYVKTFPDGETQVQIEDNIRGHNVFIVQPTCSPANHHIMELLLMVDAAKRASARQITAVIPYFGYARQDRKDKSRVPISAKLVANLLTAAGVNRLITLDLHAPQIQGFFDIPVDHLYAAPVFRTKISESGWTPEVILAPDMGSVKLATSYSEYFGCGVGFVAKRRKDAETVEAMNVIADVAGKRVLITDDLTESAGTILQAAKIVKEAGAISVRAAVTHGVLTEKGYERLNQDTILECLYVTDSTPVRHHPKVSVLSIAELVAKAIHGVHNDTSVSKLFK